MKFDDLIAILGKQSFFDLTTVVQLSGDSKESVKTQLYRWAKAGKVLSLRRGMYAFADMYRRHRLNPLTLANQLYRPSYLSLEWALGFYGLIPEKVVTLTSVTPKVPRCFNNAVGEFRYVNVKQSLFWGYKPVEIQGEQTLLALPEKALLDLWHLGTGEWTDLRMAEMRFQNFELIELDRLEDFVNRFNMPRLYRAMARWRRLQATFDAGAVTI